MTPRLVLLRLGEKQFALSLENVWHILLAPRLFPLALIRPGFKGVFLHQGDVLPLLDLPGLLSVRFRGGMPLCHGLRERVRSLRVSGRPDSADCRMPIGHLG
ncbi:chemotaxis protein CheW [Desulfuromonas carbonis]